MVKVLRSDKLKNSVLEYVTNAYSAVLLMDIHRNITGDNGMITSVLNELVKNDSIKQFRSVDSTYYYVSEQQKTYYYRSIGMTAEQAALREEALINPPWKSTTYTPPKWNTRQGSGDFLKVQSRGLG